METDIKMSIIVTVFNTEKYIEEAIQSVINQTLKEIQIIIVDDGSEDGSGKICDKYAEKDARIQVVHTTNRGVAEARNEGIRLAKGKYLMFLDGDDQIVEDACEWMYNVIEREKVDFVNANYQMTYEDGTRWPNVAFDQQIYQDFKLDLHDFKKSFFVMNTTACIKLFSKQFLIDNNITFEVQTPAEDAYFTLLCYMKGKGYYTNKVIYLYRTTPNSRSSKSSIKYFSGINNTYRKIYEKFVENDEIAYYRYLYAKTNAYIVCQLIDSPLLNDEEKVQSLKEFEWYFELYKELKISEGHESLRKLMDLIRKKDYSNAIIEMKQLQEYRKSIPETIKKRMSFPTTENYEAMSKYDNEFLK